MGVKGVQAWGGVKGVQAGPRAAQAQVGRSVVVRFKGVFELLLPFAVLLLFLFLFLFLSFHPIFPSFKAGLKLGTVAEGVSIIRVISIRSRSLPARIFGLLFHVVAIISLKKPWLV